jgi:hypothetical protein
MAAVLSRGTSLAGGGSATAAALLALDSLNELALTHPARTSNAHRLGQPLKVGQQHAGQPGTATAGGLVSHRLTGRGARGRLRHA